MIGFIFTTDQSAMCLLCTIEYTPRVDGVGVGLWYLTPLSTIFQLYRGGKFYWWWKPEYGDYPEKITDQFYHIILYWVNLAWEGFELATLVVTGTDNTDGYISNLTYDDDHEDPLPYDCTVKDKWRLNWYNPKRNVVRCYCILRNAWNHEQNTKTPIWYYNQCIRCVLLTLIGC